jgi:hypothetical protein
MNRKKETMMEEKTKVVDKEGLWRWIEAKGRRK